MARPKKETSDDVSAVPATALEGAQPGTTDTKAKKVVKVYHPDLELDEDGAPTVKLGAYPADYDTKVHRPLLRRDFSDETVWLIARAVTLEERAANYRQEAADWAKLGSIKDRAKAKRLVQMQRRMEELKAQLKAQNIDVDALLGTDEKDADEDEGEE